jgi:hypothetical protein
MLARTATTQTRLKSMEEVQRLSDKLARDGVPVSVNVLKRAMLVPDEQEIKPGTREYPDPGLLLMVNPFPKAKKKKGKKKK